MDHIIKEKQAYNSSPDIKVELSKDNIELVPLAYKYVKGFKILVKDYEKEHQIRMKTEREDRKRTFNQMLNKSKNVVADELLFTATNEFFKDMTKEDILDWANTCMEFVYEDLGYTKDQVLHSVVHLDEKTLDCQDYSIDTIYTLTHVSHTTNKVLSVYKSLNLSDGYIVNYSLVRPTLYLNANVEITGGDGSSTNHLIYQNKIT